MKNQVLIVCALLISGFAFTQQKPLTREGVYMKENPYLTFLVNEDVTRENVTYKNRYGITLAAHMYYSEAIDKTQKYPALVIGPPYGGVKEQGPGVYANELAQRGFIALAFDPSFNGESGGEARDVSSPDFFVEDFSAGVDFLGTLPFVDREKIGAIGICGSGGFSLTAAQVDHRIKAVATASMYDISSMHRDGFGYSLTDEQRNQQLDTLSKLRWKDFETGTPVMPQGGWPSDGPAAAIPDGIAPIMAEFFEYYGMERGWHPNTLANFTLTSALSFINFPLMSYIDTISPRPIMLIMGENAHSRYYSEEAFEKAQEPKELVIVPGARHIDLYDKTDVIPFDALDTFFHKYLR
jgi:fermentation-respiration switch protein FrsA (DUF1100 family)